MKFSTRSRYGIQIMLELANQYDKSPIFLKDIAARQDISLKYLEQLIIPLRVGGLVKNIRGGGGGYSLVKAPEQITILEIIQTLEGPLNLVSCLEDEQTCPKSGRCAMQEIWQGVKERVESILASRTLADLYQRQLAFNNNGPVEPARKAVNDLEKESNGRQGRKRLRLKKD